MRKNSTVRHVLCRTVELRFGVWEAFCARIRESLLKALVEKRRRKRRNVENGGRFLDTERQIYLVIFRIIALQKGGLSRGMLISAEEFLFINFCMDFLFLYLASRGTWFLNWLRLITASVFASAYALWDAIHGCFGVLDILALVAVWLIAFPVRDARLFLKTAALSFTGLMVFGSSVRIGIQLGERTLVSGAIGALLGAAIMTMAKAAFQKMSAGTKARFRVRFSECTAEFTAVIDTGNLLIEPISALPVLIADEKALGKRFGDFARSNGKLRKAAYASVGGLGVIECLRTDRMEVNFSGKWRKAPDMWLGLYPGVMRGGVHALAPGHHI